MTMMKNTTPEADLQIDLTLTPPSPPGANINTNINAEAKLSDGTYLMPGYTIQLEIEGGSSSLATFQNADGGSNGKLYTSTTNPLGRIDATFTDAYGDSGKVKASVTGGPSSEKSYLFIGPPLTINLYPALDCATANSGDSSKNKNRILAAVYNNGQIADSYADSVIFTVDKDAVFANADSGTSGKQITVPINIGFAQADFTDDQEESVTVTAVLAHNQNTPSVTQGFNFYSDDHVFPAEVAWQSSTHDDDFSGRISAFYRYDAAADPGQAKLYICLPATCAAFFDSNVSPVTNDKVIQVGNAKISSDYNYIAVWDYANDPELNLELTISAPGVASPATTLLSFGADDDGD